MHLAPVLLEATVRECTPEDCLEVLNELVRLRHQPSIVFPVLRLSLTSDVHHGGGAIGWCYRLPAVSHPPRVLTFTESLFLSCDRAMTAKSLAACCDMKWLEIRCGLRFGSSSSRMPSTYHDLVTLVFACIVVPHAKCAHNSNKHQSSNQAEVAGYSERYYECKDLHVIFRISCLHEQHRTHSLQPDHRQRTLPEAHHEGNA